MFNKILLNVLLKETQSIGYVRSSKKAKIIRNIASFVCVFVVFGFVMMPIMSGADDIKNIVGNIDLGKLILSIGIYGMFILNLISIFIMIFTFAYLDKNLNNYLILPFSRKEFANTKLLSIYLTNIKFSAILLIPFIFLFIAFSGFQILPILEYILYTLTVPIFTIYISCLILGTVMFFVNKMKNKQLGKRLVIGIGATIVFVIYLYYIFYINDVSNDNYFLRVMELFARFQSTIDFFRPVLSFSHFANDFIYTSNFLNILYMGLIIVIGYVAIIYFHKVYYAGVIGLNEGGGSRKRRSKKLAGIKQWSMTKWFFVKEFKEIFKTPTYFMNTVFTNILIVAIYLGMLGYQYFFNGMASELAKYNVNEFLNIHTVILVTLGLGTFFCLFNMGPASSYSRDAKILKPIKTLPINYKQAFFGKILFYSLVEFLTLVVFLLPIMIVLKVSIFFITIAILCMILISISTILLPFCIDLTFPTLNWESESAVAKRSRGIYLYMLAVVIICAIVGVGSYLVFTITNKIDYIAYYMVIFYVILFILLLLYYNKKVDSALNKV